jgi:hypothetical protein
MICLGAIFALVIPAATPDANAIVRKALGSEISRQQRLQNYTWEEKMIEKNFDQKGKSLATHTKVFENLILDGSEYRRLIEEDGKPLAADRARKEQEKMDREIARRRSESAGQRQHRLDEQAKRRQEGIKFREEVLSAFVFTVAGEETVRALACWKIQAEPKRGYAAQSRQGKLMLGKLRGSLWITKSNSDLVKVDAVTTDKITFGGFLVSLSSGAHIALDMMRVNDELWHPESIRIGLSARALLKHYNLEEEIAFRNFRKFQTDSKLVAEEAH